MADTYSVMRTNYFQIKDLEKLKNILSWFPGIQLFKHQQIEDKYAFGGADLSADRTKPQCPYHNIQDIPTDLKPLIPDGEAIVLQYIGHEKLNYLDAYAQIVTNHTVTSVQLQDTINQTVRSLLKQPGYQVQLIY